MSQNPTSGPSREMFKRDRHFWWRPKRIYIPAWQFSGVAYEATTGNAIKSIGTGTPDATNLALNEVNTSGITGMLLKTVDNSVNHAMEIPADMDLAYPIYTSLHWAASDASGSVQWVMFYKVFIPGTTVLGSAEAATAMDGLIGAHSTGGAYVWNQTPEMKIFGAYKIPDTTSVIQWKIQMHALTTITLPFLLGMTIRYTPRKFYYGDGMSQEAKAPLWIGSNKYSV